MKAKRGRSFSTLLVWELLELVAGVVLRLGAACGPMVRRAEVGVRVCRPGRRVGVREVVERWNLERYWNASDEEEEGARLGKSGFHSVGSRSGLALWSMGGLVADVVVMGSEGFHSVGSRSDLALWRMGAFNSTGGSTVGSRRGRTLRHVDL